MINLNDIPKLAGIYKFTNKINNKVYIGQGKNLQVRIQGHLNSYKNENNNKYFHRSIRKYKIENFQVEILVQEKNLLKPELDDLEIDFIRLYNSNNPKFGYNMTTGGEGSNGYKHTQEAKEKFSKIHKGKKHTQEAKEKIGKASSSRKMSQETKKNVSKVHKGKIVSEETKQKLRDYNLGKKLTEETRKKMRNKIISQETRKKMSKSHKENLGKKHTKETIEKIRQASLSKESVEKREKTRKLNRFKKQLTELFYNELIKI